VGASGGTKDGNLLLTSRAPTYLPANHKL